MLKTHKYGSTENKKEAEHLLRTEFNMFIKQLNRTSENSLFKSTTKIKDFQVFHTHDIHVKISLNAHIITWEF